MAQDLTAPAQETAERASRRRSIEPAQAEPELFAALDLGTNSCRMLIAAPDGGHFRIVDAFANCCLFPNGIVQTNNGTKSPSWKSSLPPVIAFRPLTRAAVGRATPVADMANRLVRPRNTGRATTTIAVPGPTNRPATRPESSSERRQTAYRRHATI